MIDIPGMCKYIKRWLWQNESFSHQTFRLARMTVDSLSASGNRVEGTPPWTLIQYLRCSAHPDVPLAESQSL